VYFEDGISRWEILHYAQANGVRIYNTAAVDYFPWRHKDFSRHGLITTASPFRPSLIFMLIPWLYFCLKLHASKTFISSERGPWEIILRLVRRHVDAVYSYVSL